MLDRTVLVCLCLLAVGSVSSKSEERYSDKYDNIDVDAILANAHRRNQYLQCFLETAPCPSGDAAHLKELFAEAVVTTCKKCTEKQKQAFEKILLYYTESEPKKWSAVLQKSVVISATHSRGAKRT